ncbi:MAG TPA: polysaccharide deacetylase family protein [Solirubrobacterales bacterium]|nr:polysaccharide deacetylase family protein [Solirubrobacterales bacterium]
MLVVCYHAVSREWRAELAVSPEQLEDELRYLLGRGFDPVTFTKAVAGSEPGRVMAVTFDDAYRSVYEAARPILERLGVPGTVFVPTSFPSSRAPMSWPGIDGFVHGPSAAELVPASWDELRTLSRSGWEIGSHTRSHPHLPRLGDAELTRELEESRRECESHVGAPCTAIAYPYGDTDERVARTAAAAGYAAGAALYEPLMRKSTLSDPMRWPRLVFNRRDGRLRARVKVRLFTGGPGVWNLLHGRADR